MAALTDILTLKFLTGRRTLFIGAGLILSALGMVLAHLAAVIGGEKQLGDLDWGAVGTQFVTGFGLITASLHKPTP